jgi:hypothetical protein
LAASTLDQENARKGWHCFRDEIAQLLTIAGGLLGFESARFKKTNVHVKSCNCNGLCFAQYI